MWIITSLSSGEVFYLIKEKPKYIVGRAGADIILKDDTSISRAHAVLQLEIDEDIKSVILVDTESKYGTYHNDGIQANSKICPNVPVQLRDGDRIRFGLLKNEWKLTKFHIRCMPSKLSSDTMKSLEKCVNALGGFIIPKWESSCTHLVMEELTVTIKALHALLNNIPIVTCDYWRDVLDAARNNLLVLPRANNYMPQSVLMVNKSELNFGYRPDRRTLFSGITFIFMHKTHLDTYGPIVEQAGGTVKDLNSGVQKTLIVKSNVVVIQYVPSTQSQSSQTINNITELLESHSKRIIPEYEIGLAIVLCSIEKYCNPDFKDLSEIMPATETTTSQDAVITDDMRISDTKSISGSDLEIAETDATIQSTNSQNEINASGESVTIPNSLTDGKETYESMAIIAVTPSINTEPELKRKRLLDTSDGVNSDDENSPQPPKKANLAVESKDLHMKPLPIVIKKRNTVNVWLNKTQTLSQKEGEESATTSDENKSPHGTKRGRIAVINDNDSGDENDLFNFGASGSACAKKMRIDNDADGNAAHSDEEIFDFKKTSTDNVLNDNSEILDATQEFIAKDKPQNNGVVTPTIKRKTIPQKVSTEGWLCCSFNQMNVDKIKTEIKTEIKMEDDMTKEQKEYIDSLKGGFEVRIGAIKICPKENVTTHNDNVSNGDSSSTNKNYKTFVKKCNYIPQNKVINVVRVPVDPIRRV